ncbi:unnamed protein product [Ixodes persulcatus]
MHVVLDVGLVKVITNLAMMIIKPDILLAFFRKSEAFEMTTEFLPQTLSSRHSAAYGWHAVRTFSAVIGSAFFFIEAEWLRNCGTLAVLVTPVVHSSEGYWVRRWDLICCLQFLIVLFLEELHEGPGKIHTSPSGILQESRQIDEFSPSTTVLSSNRSCATPYVQD